MNSEKIFQSILNERYFIDEIDYPKTATFKSGKPKKLPFLFKYIYENPGCTKKDAAEYLSSIGLAPIPMEYWSWLEKDDMLDSVKVGTTNKYFPTEKLVNYLKSINIIDNISLNKSNDIKNKIKNNYEAQKQQKDLYNNIKRTISSASLTNEQISEVLSQILQNYSK